ncbi:MAG TPA: hypothetical protein VGV07_04000 [Devosia sp.]|jgi:hypothetical protein|uniref:hypothetical protein n=1 Tax=Devosia sp. TaxID=1871048 RepID=UPI002DDCD221|nr:hypothetical protein [Devosia sp.]HEV2514387.1 hypothetical protein [Devosia sp.]
MTQRTFGPEKRDGKWYFYAYIDGQQVEWGPYSSEEFAMGAKDAIERRLSEEADRPEPPAEVVGGEGG